MKMILNNIFKGVVKPLEEGKRYISLRKHPMDKNLEEIHKEDINKIKDSNIVIDLSKSKENIKYGR